MDKAKSLSYSSYCWSFNGGQLTFNWQCTSQKFILKNWKTSASKRPVTGHSLQRFAILC